MRNRNKAEAEKGRTVESWNDADCKLVVTQPEGWSCRVSLQTRVHLPPDQLYEMLTQPDNSKVFRNIKGLKSRRVLEDDGKGRQLVEVEQEAVWKFLCFGGTFTTKLLVNQNKRNGEISFRLVEAGMMKKFEGTWQIQAFNEATLVAGAGTKPRPHWFQGPGQALKGLQKRIGGGGAAEASLLTLEQSVLPNVTPPKPLDRLLKGIAARQVRSLVEDVRSEVGRRQAATLHAGRETDKKQHSSSSGDPLASLSRCIFHGWGPKL